MRAASVGLSRPGTHGDEIAQLFRQRRQRRGNDPAVLTAAAGRDQDAEIAERVGRLGNLLQIVEIDIAAADRSAEITAVAMVSAETRERRSFPERGSYAIVSSMV